MIYDRLGRWYDLLTAFGEARLRDAGLDLLRARPSEVALEVGPGTGHGLLRLAREVRTTGFVVGIDLSAVMLDVARERLASAGLLEQVAQVRGDARRLPLPSGSVDAAFASFSLELFGDADLGCALREIRRVLRPDGRLVVVALDARGEPSALCSAYEWAHRKWPAVVDCRPIRVREALETAGFEVVEAREDANWGLPVSIVLARPAAGR